MSGDTPWPETAYLLLQPDPSEFTEFPPESILTLTWRRLFRARVREAVRRALARNPEVAVARVEAIGRVEFEEARSVLRKDGYLFPDDGEADVYAAFAAVFLELSLFAPALRGASFPAVEVPDAAEAVFANDVDAPALWDATRPLGAPNPPPPEPDPNQEDDSADSEATEGTGDAGPPAHPDLPGHARARERSLSARAKAVSEKGNNVRAALLWAREAKGVPPEAAETARAAARAELKHLANRLQKALFVRKGEAELWADALGPLLRPAADGFWSPEARMLFDLQKVCLDHEREVFRLEPLGWLLSRGRRPLKRPLPHLREVTMSNHLRAAARRLPSVQITREERARLDGLLRPALHRAEDALRERFRPRVDEALASTWVRPQGVAERVAYHKLVEELLDQLVGRGFSTLGDLRDFASRSNLKMPDLAEASEFFHGDRLLAADRALAERLDGVYRPGEVYLRWFQRFSALAFGTPVGRFVTLFIALPYGGAYVALKGLEEIVTVSTKVLEMLGKFVPTHVTEVHLHTVNPWSILLLGSVALGAINYVRFRAEVIRTVIQVARGLRGLFVDLPTWLLNSPLLLRLVQTPPVQAVWRFVLKPGLVAAPIWGAARLLAGGAAAQWAGAFAFIGAAAVFNTRAGMTLEEVVVDAIGRAFRSLAFDVIPGLFRLIMSLFEDMLGWVEKLIYAVDEWLRFRSGQSAAVLAVKALLGMGWAVLAYLIRIYVNLLIEPQINPIKHFPVVTVSHKVILPLSIKLTLLGTAVLTPFLGKDLALFVAGANVLLLPGVFGFLAWELKSNWRLYEANRPARLVPVMVGSHGETVVGLLRPGFHSGTLPKQFTRFRRARRAGLDKSALKHREALHHVEEALRRFVDRDLAALLAESRAFGGVGVQAGSIRLATNRVRMELPAGAFEAPALTIDFEERPGFLAAGVSQTGWLAHLTDEQRNVLNAALLGLFTMSGVERLQTPGGPVNDPEAVRLTDHDLSWSAWSEGWDAEQSGSPGFVTEPPRDFPNVLSRHAPGVVDQAHAGG